MGCSTPFGITVVGTRVGRRRYFRLLSRAQRLSASLWSAPFLRNVLAVLVCVLNAFRHHCGRHGIPAVMVGLLESRAQRLSASLWSALAISFPITCPTSPCSTPFGITVVGTAVGVPDGGSLPGCSTPFGITVVGTLSSSAVVIA